MNENNEIENNGNIENQQVQDKNKKVQKTKNGKCKKVIAGIAVVASSLLSVIANKNNIKSALVISLSG